MTCPGNGGMFLVVAIAALSFRVTCGPDGTRQTLPSLSFSLLGLLASSLKGGAQGPAGKTFW